MIPTAAWFSLLWVIFASFFNHIVALTNPHSTYLVKTTETFKLAELQFLEAKLQGDLRNYSVSPILVDRATGSTILEVTGLALDFDDPQNWPSSLRRCAWVLETIEEARSANSLLKKLQSQIEWRSVPECWSLDYKRFDDVKIEGRPEQPMYTMKTLLCAVAHALPSSPTLDVELIKDKLLLVDTKMTSGSKMTLGRLAFVGDGTKQSTLHRGWGKRPFQYSSAINTNVAEIAVDFLLDYLKIKGLKSSEEVRLCDPTCGSGTLLAFALAQGMKIFGCDVNPQCATGTMKNLEHFFGESIVSQRASILPRDSTSSWPNDWGAPDCVVANLPWGINTVEYQNENLAIVNAIRESVDSEAPCIFVTRHPYSKLLSDAGFEVLGQAHIPPLNTPLPNSKKQKKIQVDGTDRKDLCVVTITRAK